MSQLMHNPMFQPAPFLKSATAMLCAAVLAACGGGDDGAPGVSSVLSTTLELAGTNCATGGTRIEAGADRNGDGVLQAEEITTTEYICNGATGPAGATGPEGAAGAEGATGATGANGFNSLIATSSEAPGSNCSVGGTRVDAGLDNGDGGSTANDNVLSAGEIDQTAYVCRTEPLGFSWENVITDVAVQTAVNTGYIANNTTAQVVFTLPATASVGEIVRIKGSAAPGWKLTQNSGQSVNLANLSTWSQLSGSNWSQVLNTGSIWETSVASSSDGRIVAALPHFGPNVHVSSNAGTTWQQVTLPENMVSVVMAPDASMIYARTESGSRLYRSSDRGATWTPINTMSLIRSLAPFNGGLVGLGTVGGVEGVYVSTDGGDNWTHRPITGLTAGACLGSVTVSSSGTSIVAFGSGEGSCPSIPHYISHDGGVTWGNTGAAGPFQNRSWNTSISANGRTLVASSANGNVTVPIFVSNDGGTNWLNTGVTPPNTAGRTAISSTGKRMVMAAGASVYVSNNAGTTWTSFAAPAAAFMPAGSSDLSTVYFGSGRVAPGSSTQVFKSVSLPGASFTSSGTAGSVTGGASDALELQFLGGGAWGLLSGVGSDFLVE